MLGSRRLSDLSTAGKNVKRQRFECQVCRERWTTLNGTLLSLYQADKVYDWRVPAAEGCTGCIHLMRGFCSLGFPEAADPGFVTECEARQVQGGVCVVH